MRNLSYIDATKLVLEKAKFPLKVAEIWKEIVKQRLDERLKSISKTPERSLHTILLFYIRSKQLDIFVFSENPRTFWLTSRKNELENSKKQNIFEQIQKKEEQELQENLKFNERDLHPLLVKFLYESEFNAYAKTIYHEKSKARNQGLNKWLHPDIVGVHFVFDDFNNEVVSLLKNLNKASYKLYSFEIKKALDSHFKEYYFQAVSNSSWANEGYLVVFDDSIDQDKFEELERLNESFGIGLIKLGANLADFEILLKSKQRELDIKTIDKLITENKDFASFIKNINDKVETHGKGFKIQLNFDEILSDEALEKYLKSKNINKEE